MQHKAKILLRFSPKYLAPFTSVLFAVWVTACAGLQGTGEPVVSGAHWKITFPVAGPNGHAREMLNPEFSACLQDNSTFPDGLNTYIYPSPEGLVFNTEYTGITTSSDTTFSRTELREMRGSEEANWTLAEGGILEARLKIDALAGGANKLFFMQIHGHEPASEPLLKCIWEKGHIRLLSKTGPKLKDLRRQQKYVAMPLGHWFTCSIHASRDSLSIRVNGETIETYKRDVLDDWPEDNTYFFKAGNYLQSDTPGAAARVVFSSINVVHATSAPTAAGVSP